MTKIVLHKFGRPSSEEVEEIVKLIEECYDSLEDYQTQLVEILFFEERGEMKLYLNRERRRIGIQTQEFGEKFYAIHEAWTGIPRIWICLENLKQTDNLIYEGVLRHEVGHSILHGSIEYYLIPTPPSLSEFSRRTDLPREYVTDLLYLISIAVKDFEVTRMLVREGFVESQIAYAKEILSASEEDIASWQLAKNHPRARALCLIARLKDLTPTIALQKTGIDFSASELTRSLAYLPPRIQKRMLSTTEKLPEVMNGDTFKNLNAATRVVIDRLLRPLFTLEEE